MAYISDEEDSGDVNESPRGETPPRFMPNEGAELDEALPRLVVRLQDLVLPDDVVRPPTAGCTGCFVAAWIGPLGPRRVYETLPVFAPRGGGQPLMRCRFVLPIDRKVQGAWLCVELVRVEPRPTDPGTSSRERVLGRARVKLDGHKRRPWQASLVLPLYAYSPSPGAVVGSVRLDMELRDPVTFIQIL